MCTHLEMPVAMQSHKICLLNPPRILTSSPSNAPGKCVSSFPRMQCATQLSLPIQDFQEVSACGLHNAHKKNDNGVDIVL